MDYRPAAYAVIVNDRQEILLSHWVGGFWTLPGGGMDPGEHPEDAALREVTEETGYTARLTGLIGVNSHVIPGKHRTSGTDDLQILQIVYTAEIVGGEMQVEVGGSTDDVGWFKLTDVPSLDHSVLVGFGLGRFEAGTPGHPIATRPIVPPRG